MLCAAPVRGRTRSPRRADDDAPRAAGASATGPPWAPRPGSRSTIRLALVSLQDQIAAHEAVFDAVRQPLQPLENQRRHRGQRRRLRIVGVHPRRRSRRHLLHRRERVADRTFLGVLLDDSSELIRRAVEAVAGLGVGRAARMPSARLATCALIRSGSSVSFCDGSVPRPSSAARDRP